MKTSKSWKTTLSGVGMILSALGIGISILTGKTDFSMEALAGIVGLVTGGIGLITAKDKDVTGVPQDGSAEKPAATL